MARQNSKRGFAAMAPQKQREIARRGGQTAHQKGTAHEFTPDEARIAGQRGGRAVSSNRQYMAEIGRRGGRSSGQHAAKLRQTQNTNGDNNDHDNGGTRGRHWSAAQSATEVIRADHKKVEELFGQYETRSEQYSQKDTLVRHLCQELDIHTRLEEEIFYPAVQAARDEESEQLVTEALKEHKTVKDLIAQLREMTPDDASRDSIVQQLKECVMHHVEEEEKEMLPKAEQLLSDQLESLGARMQQRKHELVGSLQGSAHAEMPEQHLQ